jgi:hypothetical protein
MAPALVASYHDAALEGGTRAPVPCVIAFIGVRSSATMRCFGS